MALHFDPAELRARIARVTARLRDERLDGVLLFRKESMYWLTGYDTAGYSQFPCLWLGADGGMVLLTRSSDVRQARLTSIIEDVRLWVDAAGANPAVTLRETLGERIRPGARIGVEFASVSLNTQRGRLLEAAFAPDLELVDASTLLASFAVVKSPAELAYVREAGRIADEAWRNAFAACKPGNSESDILAEIHATVSRGRASPRSSPMARPTRWPSTTARPSAPRNCPQPRR